MQAGFYIDLLALRQGVSEVPLPPKDYVRPISFVFPLTGLLIFPTPVRRHGKLRDRHAGGCELGFRVLSQVSDENNFVYAARCHNASTVSHRLMSQYSS